jgi:hypothetical protein
MDCGLSLEIIIVYPESIVTIVRDRLIWIRVIRLWIYRSIGVGSIDRVWGDVRNYNQIGLKSSVNPGRTSSPLSVKGCARTSTSQSSR